MILSLIKGKIIIKDWMYLMINLLMICIQVIYNLNKKSFSLSKNKATLQICEDFIRDFCFNNIRKIHNLNSIKIAA